MRGHIKKVVERRARRRFRRNKVVHAFIDTPMQLAIRRSKAVGLFNIVKYPIIDGNILNFKSFNNIRHYNTIFRNNIGLVYRFFYKHILYDFSSYLFYRSIILAPNSFYWNHKWQEEDKISYVGIYSTPRRGTTRYSGLAYQILTHYKPVTNILFRNRSTFDRVVQRYSRTNSISGTHANFIHLYQLLLTFSSIRSRLYNRIAKNMCRLFADVGRRVGDVYTLAGRSRFYYLEMRRRYKRSLTWWHKWKYRMVRPKKHWYKSRSRFKILNHNTRRILKYQLVHIWFFINRWSSYLNVRLYEHTQILLSNTEDVITYAPMTRLSGNYHNYMRNVVLHTHFFNKVYYIRTHRTANEFNYPNIFKQLFHDFAFYDFSTMSESTKQMYDLIEQTRVSIFNEQKCKTKKFDWIEYTHIGVKYYCGYYFDISDDITFDYTIKSVVSTLNVDIITLICLRNILITIVYYCVNGFIYK